MAECICCHSQSGAVALTCLHLICRQCLDVVKCENLVFCAECGVLSDVKPDLGDDLTLSTESDLERITSWEEATASQFSSTSISDDGSTVCFTREKPFGYLPYRVFLPKTGNIHPKYSNYSQPPDYFWCSIIHPLTPKKFVVQVHDEEYECFKTMHRDMQKFYNSIPEKRKRAKEIKREKCHIIRHKGIWHRASVVLDKVWIGVLLLDNGDRYWVHMDDFLVVQPLQPQFEELPAQALHCKMDVVPNCRFPRKKDRICSGSYLSCWSPRCLDLLKRTTHLSALCFISRKRKPLDELIVTVYIDDKEKSLNQQIIENGWTLNNLNDHIEHFKIMDTKRREVIAPVPAGIPQPKERVEQWINLQGRAWPKKFAGVVTWVDDTGGIYIHTAEWSRTLTYIRDRLKEIFASSEGSTDSLKVGACCFVKYKGNWFRAILHALTADEATVFLVDFGVLQKVAPKAIHRKDIFFKVPVQTHRCVLDGITPVNERGALTKCLTKSAVNLLHDVTINNDFHVTVRSNSPLRVSLRCMANNVDVADLLVAAKKAMYL